MSACFFIKGRGRKYEGKEEEDEEEERREEIDGASECMLAVERCASRHFHVYTRIQSQKIQYYIGDPSLPRQKGIKSQ